jgi:hypothetical protein
MEDNVSNEYGNLGYQIIPYSCIGARVTHTVFHLDVPVTGTFLLQCFNNHLLLPNAPTTAFLEEEAVSTEDGAVGVSAS